MDNAQTLIEIIDQRIDSYIKNSKILCRYSGVVQGIVGEQLQVKLLGTETTYTFAKRSYIDAKVGDYVFVESKIGNITNGVVVDIL